MWVEKCKESIKYKFLEFTMQGVDYKRNKNMG